MQVKQRRQRIIDLDEGTAMIVADLHGDWDAYRRYRDTFLRLQASGQADYLIFLGDLIHREGPPEEDASLALVLDVLALQKMLGDQLIYLLGNHEMPHIYGISLQKGEHEYTPRFEAMMGDHREEILALFDSLPFYARTQAGVSLAHAGSAPILTTRTGFEQIAAFSHQKLREQVMASIPPAEYPSLRRAMSKFGGVPYEEQAKHYLAVSGPADARYNDFLIGYVVSVLPEFEALWEALFTKNEYQYGDEAYAVMVTTFLEQLSADYTEQTLLVSGHIGCEGGYTLVGEQQLRLASATHAHPRESGLYLLFDTGRKIESRQQLMKGLATVFS